MRIRGRFREGEGGMRRRTGMERIPETRST
jgi:hypothetical protein